MANPTLNTIFRIKAHGGGGHYLTVTGNMPLANNRPLCLTTAMSSNMQYWKVISSGNAYKIVSCANENFALNYYWINGYGNSGPCDVYPHASNTDAYVLFDDAGHYTTIVYRIKQADSRLASDPLYLTPSSYDNGASVTWETNEGGDVIQYWLFEEVGEISDDDEGTESNFNYATYPCKKMNITQKYDGAFSHIGCSTGTPCDYPTDEACENSGRSWMYCPCDEMEVIKLYGVGISDKTNTIWLKSTSPVKMPIGENYLVMMVIHPEDDDLSSIQVGTKFHRGDQMFREGKDGYATGYHFHISLGTGNGIIGTGWQKNSLGEWVLTPKGNTIKIEEAFYLDTNFTTVINNQGISFINKP